MLCVREHLFKEKLGAKYFVFSVLPQFPHGVHLVLEDCGLHSCAAVMLSQDLQLCLGKADGFR